MIYAAESKFDQKNRVIVPMNVFKAAGMTADAPCTVEYDNRDGRLYIVQGEAKKRINAQYTIIKSLNLGLCEFVLGKYSEVDYVTWEYTESGGYFWGHYFGTEEDALADLYKRAAAECSMRAGLIEDQREGGKNKCLKRSESN